MSFLNTVSRVALPLYSAARTGVNLYNAARPRSVAGGGGIGGGSSGRSTASASYRAPATPDPLAAQRAMFQRERPVALENIRGNARNAFGSAKRNLQGNAENLFNSIRSGQKSITRARENVELNRLNGIRDILGFVRDGLKQGTTRLSQTNSLDSSATDSLARAYSDIGADKNRALGNQAFLENRDIDTSQEELDVQEGSGRNDFNRIRDEQVQTIGNQMRQQLLSLDQQAAGLSIPDRIAVDAEKQRVIDEGLAQLAEVDRWLQEQLGTVNPASQDAIRAAARELQTAGTAGENPFDLGGTPGQTMTGPAISQLPLFTRPRRTD